MKYDPELNRRRSQRLAGYDYRCNGAYFVTLCTHERQRLFGEITDSVFELSAYGDILLDEWLWTPVERSDISLDAYVIMPNHFHGVIILHGGAEKQSAGSTALSARLAGAQRGSLGAIVGQVKFLTSRRINRHRNTSSAQFWQRGFYDHIIRNDTDLDRIRAYIEGNPERWQANEDANRL